MRDTVTFDVGSADENTISLNALVLDDRLVEGTESLTLIGSIISGPPGASFSPGQDRVTFNILDNDSKFHPSIDITVGKYHIHAITMGMSTSRRHSYDTTFFIIVTSTKIIINNINKNNMHH